MTLTPIDADNRVRLTAEWTQALGLRDLVLLERTCDGILIRDCPRTTWDEIFATKLVIGAVLPPTNEDAADTAGDDFLF